MMHLCIMLYTYWMPLRIRANVCIPMLSDHLDTIACIFFLVLSLVSSILTLTLIACDRFFGIIFAMRAHLTARRPATFILLVWLSSGAIAAPLLFYRTQLTRVWLNHTEVWCSDSWPYVELGDMGSNSTVVYSSLRTVYYTLVSLMLYFVPVLVMTIAYAVIIGKLWSHRTPGEGVEVDAAAQLTVKRKVSST